MWRDGTSHLLFEPIEFLERLAALIPRPAVNLLLYHGLLAPACAVALTGYQLRPLEPEPSARPFDASPRAAGTPGAWPWAAPLCRGFDFDVLTCPRCGSRLRVIATVQDPLAVQAILASLARSGAPAPPGPAPPAPAALT